MLKLCQKVQPVKPRHGDKDEDVEEVKSSYLAIHRFTTLPTLYGNIMHTDHLESH